MSETTKTEQTPVNIAENTSVSNTQADENTPKAKVNPNFTPNYNIRNARVTDVNYIKTFAINGKSIAEALAEVVKLAQTPKATSIPLKENEYIITVPDSLCDHAIGEETIEETIERLINELSTARKESAQLRIYANSKQAKENEVYISFTDKTAANIRKVRPFIAKQNYLLYEKNNQADFLNVLVNHAVNKVLRIDFDNVINPL